MSRVVLVLLAVGLTAASARAQGLEGAWRFEGVDERGRPTAGVLRITGPAPDYRYERHGRADLTGPVVVERGAARVQGGALLTSASTNGGLAGALSGPASTPAWAGRYPLAPGAALASVAAIEGSRTLSGRTVADRLVRVDEAVAGNSVRLLVDGEAFAALRADLGQARRTVDLQVFQWVDDATGRSIADLLGARARAGVDVRCLVDARSKTVTRLVYGKQGRDFTDVLDDELRATGAEVVVQHTAAEGIRGSLDNLGRGIRDGFGRLLGRGSPPPRESRGWSAHDHRKITVVDSQVAFMGGQNIGASYENAWHDVQARIEGPAVDALAALFQDRWTAAGGKRPPPGPAAPASRAWTGDVPIEVVGSLPGLPDAIHERTMRAIREARREVLVEMAFLADQESIDALQAAARRGVRVAVVLPADAQNVDPVTREAFRWVQNDVLRSGVELYKLRGRMVHAKLATFDGKLATLGSHNMSGSDLAEVNIFVPDPRFVRVMNARLFEVDLPNSDRVQVEKLTWTQKAVSLGARALRALL